MAVTEEQITILRLQTAGVESVQDLKDNIRDLKKAVDEATIGSDEYREALGLLRQNQDALKDAMHGSSATFDEIKASAHGMSDSYNSLVHRMAALKEEFRSTTDVMRRVDLGNQIKAINDQLKSLDELQGNHQRNVGNYAESIKKAFSEMPEYAEPVKKAFENVDKSMGLLSKNPLIGIITLLFPLIQKITEELKGNSTAIEAVDKAMVALKPVTDFFSRIIQKIADLLSDVITKVVSFVTSNGLFSKIINGIVGVGNAIVQFLVAPTKAMMSAIKVLQEEGLKGAKNALKAYVSELKSGISFKANYQAGETIAEGIVAGVTSKKKEVKDAVSSGIKEGVEEGIKLADWEKALAEGERKAEEARRLRLEQQKEIDDLVKADIDATNAEIEAMFAEMDKQEEEQQKNLAETIEARHAMLEDMVAGTSSILSSIADLYESNAENSERAEKKVKNIRIASAMIDTISGAVAAFMSVWKNDGFVKLLGPAATAVYAASMSASVLAAGMANIAKMRATNVSSSGGAATIGASVSAPAIGMGIPQTSIINSNAQDARFDRMAQDQRVYILQSDIEAKGRASKARIRESSF